MKSKRRRTWLWVVLGLVAAVFGYLFLWPTKIDPLPFEAPPAPEATGSLAPNEALRSATLFSTAIDGGGHGPETTTFDAEGRIYAGTNDGRIVRMKNDGSGLETFANTGGRPLGLAFDDKQNLIVADAIKGLLSLDAGGQVTVLATEAGGVPFLITDDLDIAKDGRIYFSDASSRFDVRDYVLDMLEGRPNGRLLRYDPKTRQVEVLIPELYFANGVALSEDDSFVLVNETAALRVTRLWLTGARAGQREVFTDALPGYPDGIARGTGGRFWVAIFAPRVKSAEWLGPRPWLKKVVSRLPRAMWPAPARYGCAISLDQQGKVLASFQDPDGSRVRSITSVEEHDGWLYFGTLQEPTIARLRLPE